MNENFSLWGRRDVLLVGGAAIAAGLSGCAILRGGAKHPLLAPDAAGVQGMRLTIRDEALSVLQEGGVLEVKPGDGFAPFLLTRDGGDQLRGVAARCTHKGCIVDRDGANGGWACPCHGSRFAADGAVVNGPAQAPLAALRVERVPGGIAVDLTPLAASR